MRQLHRWPDQLNNEIKSKDTFTMLYYYLQGHRNGGSRLSVYYWWSQVHPRIKSTKKAWYL